MFRRLLHVQRFGGLSVTLGATARFYATSDPKDLYKLLGVSPTASADEIKRAYREMAKKKHPDAGGNSDEFAKINAAYEVLGDPKKREAYDHYGVDSDQPGMGGAGMHGDIFEELFKGMGGGFGRGPSGPPQTEDAAVGLEVTLEDLFKGTNRTIRLRRPTVCAGCMGSGSNRPGAKKQCHRCNGSGQEIITNQLNPGMVQQFQTTCRVCKGSGSTLKPEDACRTCHGEGFENKEASVNVDLGSGIFPGDVIILKGEAGCLPGATPGDLHVQINVQKHERFVRRGFDLIYTQEIPLAQALIGYDFTVKHLDGRLLHLKASPRDVVNTNSVILARGEGMPRPDGNQRTGTPSRGNLYVFIKVAMPNIITAEQKDKLKTLFHYTEPQKPVNATVVGPEVLPLSAEDLVKNKSSEWSSAEQSSGDDQHEKVSRETYRGGGNGRTSRSSSRKRGDGGSRQTQCQTQ